MTDHIAVPILTSAANQEACPSRLAPKARLSFRASSVASARFSGRPGLICILHRNAAFRSATSHRRRWLVVTSTRSLRRWHAWCGLIRWHGQGSTLAFCTIDYFRPHSVPTRATHIDNCRSHTYSGVAKAYVGCGAPPTLLLSPIGACTRLDTHRGLSSDGAGHKVGLPL